MFGVKDTLNVLPSCPSCGARGYENLIFSHSHTGGLIKCRCGFLGPFVRGAANVLIGACEAWIALERRKGF